MSNMQGCGSVPLGLRCGRVLPVVSMGMPHEDGVSGDMQQARAGASAMSRPPSQAVIEAVEQVMQRLNLPGPMRDLRR